ncbi:excisionase family DNA binding protein [Knoellia remsis]|uniref:Excisionase family DNA binding protein n=1 Tax=Knoellia remsis TaxID=407159 RepID=A0A2T0UJA7_9MICO|nr:helix-turn-helix domain-containing protein [Knoellia remsis]PRY57992.1 excisionase family DNA binding protein [Knoellia remsis]
MEITTREAAERLDVNHARVRALVASGILTARLVGRQWLVDTDSVDRQAEMKTAQATGRPMAQRVAWAAGVLADGGRADWLTASEAYRLRRRLGSRARAEVVQRWLRSRSGDIRSFRVGQSDLTKLLAVDGVVATGVSAAVAYGLGLGTGGTGDAYVTSSLVGQLTSDFYLVESRTGNLTLRVVDGDLHLRSARSVGGRTVAPRLIVGADLADDRDARTKSAGRELIQSVLDARASG